MEFEYEGVLHSVGEESRKSERFTAREFVVTSIKEKYQQTVKFQLTQHRCEMIDEFEIGTPICIVFQLAGRVWNGRVYTNLNAVGITPIALPPPPEHSLNDELAMDDDIPF